MGFHPSQAHAVKQEAKIWFLNHQLLPIGFFAFQGRYLHIACNHWTEIISLINDPKLIERILRQLGLWKQHHDPHQQKTKAPVDGPVVMEVFDDGWPRYEEPVFFQH